MEAPDAVRLHAAAARLPATGEAFFMSAELLLGPEEIARTLRRLAHEILENNQGPAGLVFAGILSRGYPLAVRLAEAIERFEGVRVPVGKLDIGLYRDDVARRATPTPIRPSAMPTSIDDATVVLVDDVLFTGRSVRAALEALSDYGRPAKVRLAVLVDRGHRELPIRPDFVGKNLPTALPHQIRVRLTELDGEDGIYLERFEAAPTRAEGANDA